VKTSLTDPQHRSRNRTQDRDYHSRQQSPNPINMTVNPFLPGSNPVDFHYQAGVFLVFSVQQPEHHVVAFPAFVPVIFNRSTESHSSVEIRSASAITVRASIVWQYTELLGEIHSEIIIDNDHSVKMERYRPAILIPLRIFWRVSDSTGLGPFMDWRATEACHTGMPAQKLSHFVDSQNR